MKEYEFNPHFVFVDDIVAEAIKLNTSAQKCCHLVLGDLNYDFSVDLMSGTLPCQYTTKPWYVFKDGLPFLNQYLV